LPKALFGIQDPVVCEKKKAEMVSLVRVFLLSTLAFVAGSFTTVTRERLNGKD
jgi:hypothetical protein